MGGRDFAGGGAPPVSQNLRVLVDAEVTRVVDEQYERGMHLLRSNMFLLDELAKKLLETEKVGGEELVKLINQAAAAGKLVMGDQKMAAAASTAERASEPCLEGLIVFGLAGPCMKSSAR